MEIFDQQPPRPGIGPVRPTRPSPVWLLFATTLGAFAGGAIVYFSVDTSPESATTAGDIPTVTSTSVAPEETTTTTTPAPIDSALDFAYQATYPVEGSSTGFITLTDGMGQEDLPDSESSLTVNILDAMSADLDGDGVEDAVVLLSVNTSGTGVFHFIHGVFTDSGGTLATDGVSLGDRIAIDDLSIDANTGSVTVRYRDHSDQVGFTDPPDLIVVSDLQILTFGATEVGRGVIAVADADDAQLTAAATITTGGLGPVRVGMTAEEATEASGLVFVAPAPGVVEATPGCGFGRVDGFDGVGFMLIDGAIARVDVFSGPTATASGAMIGSTEDEIKTLFPGVITVSPHQYVDGNYLTLTPTAESLVDFRVVFETDGQVVTSYRSGRTPEVEWIEGCA